MDYARTARAILEKVPPEKIRSSYNCMTRLRLELSDTDVDLEPLKSIEGVKGVNLSGSELQVILGPGTAARVGKEFAPLLEEAKKAAAAKGSVADLAKQASVGDGKALHEAIREKNRASRAKKLIGRIGHIFIPLIPAFIGCGIITGLMILVSRFFPDAAGSGTGQYLRATGNAVFLVLNSLIGLYAAREFGGTPVLGAVLAALMSSPALSSITLFGSPLTPGRGGVFAAVLIGFFTATVEKWLRKKIPDAIDLFMTPLVTLILGAFAIVLVIQPVAGAFADAIGRAVVASIQTGGAVTGFILGGTFLPMVMAGIHQGLTPIHADMMSKMGYTLLLPILAMAGCGQVGASFAVYLKTKNKNLKRTIMSALPVGLLGVGEPLIYGVTLPLGRPFIGACVGGAFGGAWQAFCRTGAYAMGISGLCLAPATTDIAMYVAGAVIAYIAGFAATLIIGFDDPPEETTQKGQN